MGLFVSLPKLGPLTFRVVLVLTLTHFLPVQFSGRRSKVNKTVKVLIVEDGIKMGIMIQDYLKTMGFSNSTVLVSEMKGLGFARKEEVDLVISDLKMRGMSGLGLMKEICDTQELKGLPCIILTESGEKDDIVNATKAGVTAYLLKRLGLKSFYESIENIFRIDR